MNLVTELWIPVLTIKGKSEYASLMQVFTNGEQYADLSVRPHERVALMRLLICIAQAALDGPENKPDWKDASSRLPGKAKKYLEQWEGSFNLYDSNKPFLQIADLGPKVKEGKTKNKSISRKNGTENESRDTELFTPISKLDITLATGANSTLFDHQAIMEEKRILDERQIALSLITFQNFTASGRIGIALWGGKESPGNGASFPAPSIDKLMLHTFLRGENLLRTISMNLLIKGTITRHFGRGDAWGCPVWEMFPKSYNDEKSLLNATDTYLGRLVPITRAIKIRREKQDMILANGFKYPLFAEGQYETTATIKIKKDKRVILKVNNNAIWRELSAIIVRNISDNDGVQGPRALENICDTDFDIWCGGIEWTIKGGYVNSVESVYAISSKMLTEEGHSIYENGVKEAEGLSKKLGFAVEAYRKYIDGFWENHTDPKKNKDAFKIKDVLYSKASRVYWTCIEKQRHLLMAQVNVFGTDQLVPTCEVWRKALHKAARDAYIASCGQETPRQIRAFALGWKKLFAEEKTEDKEHSADGGEE